jgi:membrane associated rhomboid family serine protease
MLFLIDMRKISNGNVAGIFLSQFAFTSTFELIVALILIYSCRLFEHQMGSRKFGAFVIYSWVVSLAMQLLFLELLSSIGLSIIPTSGPYFFVFALISFFYRK